MNIQIETVDSWMVDAEPLYMEHWQELGLDLDLKVDPDFEKMRIMENNGNFLVITMREAGRLVGYLLAVVSTHLHYKSSPKMFIVDAYFILPEVRNGAGAKLIKFAESTANKLGAIKMYLSCKIHKDHTELFNALGYKMSDYAFIKRLG